MKTTNINKLFLYTRKSSDLINTSIPAQMETIKQSLSKYKINIDLISNSLSLTGSGFNSSKTIDTLFDLIKHKKNIIICVSDISRFTRNINYFLKYLPEIKKLNIRIFLANINKLLDPKINSDFLLISKLIKIVENESKLKSEMASVKIKEHKILIKKRNTGLALNKIYNLKTGQPEDLDEGFYRNEETCKKRKIPDNYKLSNDNNKLIKITEPENDDNLIKFNQKEYFSYVLCLLKMLVTKNTNIYKIKYYLKHLSLFKLTHKIFLNPDSFKLEKIMSVTHSFNKKIKCGNEWDTKYSKYLYNPYILNKFEIDSTFSYYGIYYNINLTPWKLKNIEEVLLNLNTYDISFKNINGVVPFDTFYSEEISKNLQNLKL